MLKGKKKKILFQFWKRQIISLTRAIESSQNHKKRVGNPLLSLVKLGEWDKEKKGDE